MEPVLRRVEFQSQEVEVFLEVVFRDAPELRQALAKEAVTILAGVDVSITDHVCGFMRDRQMCVNLLELVNIIVDRILVGAKNDASTIVLGDVFVGVLEIITNQKANSSVIPTDECQDRRFV